MGMGFAWELYSNERGNGNPTGWEWERLILTSDVNPCRCP